MKDWKKIKWLVDISEFQSEGLPIAELVTDTPIPNKEKVLSYMRNAEELAAATGIAKDAFTGEIIPEEWLAWGDGRYSWDTRILYHFEKYNLRLPDDFIDYILNETD